MAGLIATLAPLALLLSNSDWFFTREGYLDPWNYVGLFQQYLDPDYLRADYKLARLPWILAGALAAKVGPPVTAAYVLHAVFLCATSLALFLGLQALFQRPALAAVVSLWLGFYTHAHGSGGWDYHNTGAGAFYLAAFALLARPSAVDGSRVLLAGAGALAALAVHTNITLLNFLLPLAFVHLQAVRLRAAGHASGPAPFARVAWGVLGGLLVTVALGLVNWMVGREFLFFQDLLGIVVRFLGDTSNVETFHQPWSSGWVLTARYLALPAAVFIAGVNFVLARRGTTSMDRLAGALVIQYVVMALVWIAWQSAGQLALDWDYFAYVLIPSCFMAIGGLLARGWPEWCERHWLATVLCSSLVLTVCLNLEYIPGAQRLGTAMQSFVLVGGGLIFLVPLAIYRWRPAVMSAALVVAAFAFGNRVVAPGYPDYFLTDRCKIQPAVYGAIVDAASWVMEIDPLYTRVRTWFDENELIQPLEGCSVRLGHMANSITTMASVPYVARAFPLPGIDDVPAASVVALTGENRILVIISNTPAHLDAWSRRLDAMGLAHRLIGSHEVPVLASGFSMHAWSVSPGSR